jgi:uroporphyrinogen III methyltransferase / synthase
MAQPALVGRRILVTRAEHQARELAEALSALGAEPLFLPGLVIAPPQSFAAVDEALARLQQFDWIVFTSQNAVEAFGARAASRILSSRTLIAAVGPKTARALAAHGMSVDLVAEEAVAESLGRALQARVRGKRVLLPQAEEAREVLAETLRRAGALEVHVVPVYRTLPANSPAYEEVARRLVHSEIDAVTFASARTVAAVVARLRDVLGDRTIDLLRRCRIFSIGPLTTRACHAIGLAQVSEADPHTMEGMVAAVMKDIGAEGASHR